MKICVQVSKYGVEVPQEFWESSGEQGAVVSTLADGTVVSRSYQNGILDGETTYTFPNSSQIQRKEIYQKGTLISVAELYNEGTPKNEIAFDPSQPGMQTASAWYISGEPKSVEKKCKGISSSPDNTIPSIISKKERSENGYGKSAISTTTMTSRFPQDTIEGGMLSLRQNHHSNNLPKEHPLSK